MYEITPTRPPAGLAPAPTQCDRCPRHRPHHQRPPSHPTSRKMSRSTLTSRHPSASCLGPIRTPPDAHHPDLPSSGKGTSSQCAPRPSHGRTTGTMPRLSPNSRPASRRDLPGLLQQWWTSPRHPPCPGLPLSRPQAQPRTHKHRRHSRSPLTPPLSLPPPRTPRPQHRSRQTHRPRASRHSRAQVSKTSALRVRTFEQSNC